MNEEWIESDQNGKIILLPKPIFFSHKPCAPPVIYGPRNHFNLVEELDLFQQKETPKIHNCFFPMTLFFVINYK